MPDGEPDEPVGRLQQIEQELHNAIADVLNRHGLIPNKWVAGIEFLDQGGERDLEAFTSPDFRSWDSVGIVGYLDARERGATGALAARDLGIGDG